MGRPTTRMAATRAVTHAECAQFFRTTATTLYTWVDSGCPVDKATSTYDLFDVHRWLLARAEAVAGEKAAKSTASMDDLEKTKLEKDIELKDLVIQKRKGEVIPLEDHLVYVARRANSIRQFLTDMMQANAHNLAGKTVEQLRPVLFEMAKQGMDAYIGGSEEVKPAQ